MEGTQRYLMFFSYIGTNFRGSQMQKGTSLETVQSALENGLKNVLKLRGERPIRVHMLSRTDKGVHALKTALHVDLPPLKSKYAIPELLKADLNSYFSKSEKVRILDVYSVPNSFNISKSCLHKTYYYRIGVLKSKFYNKNDKYSIPLIESDRTYLIRVMKSFDVEKIKEATHLFEGKKDYGAVVGRPSHNARPTVCNIIEYKIKEAQPFMPFDPLAHKYNFYHFICKGDRFLYCMVRRMVSLSLAIGFGRIDICDIKKLFDEPIPSSWPKNANNIVSGCGLYLVNVDIDMKDLNLSEKVLENNTDEISTIT